MFSYWSTFEPITRHGGDGVQQGKILMCTCAIPVEEIYTGVMKGQKRRCNHCDSELAGSVEQEAAKEAAGVVRTQTKLNAHFCVCNFSFVFFWCRMGRCLKRRLTSREKKNMLCVAVLKSRLRQVFAGLQCHSERYHRFVQQTASGRWGGRGG